MELILLEVALMLLQMCGLTVSQEFRPKAYCSYGDRCWPSDEVFDELQQMNPTMIIIKRGDPNFKFVSNLTLNQRVTKEPGAVIFVTTIADIQAVVNFTKSYNLNLKLISSGHEFIGRNTAEGCLQLSVAKMTSTFMDLACHENSAGCVTAEPGVTWRQAYREVDAVNRVILGAHEPTVSVTGWSLGGGQSPYSPKIGLGADQILELRMVLADMSVVTMNKDGMTRLDIDGNVTSSNETDLFWAVRGGGGGTFGVVISIKFRLHMPPTKFTTFICSFVATDSPEKSMLEIKQGMRPIIANLPEEFGGYMISGAVCYAYTPECQMAVYATYIFTHYGAVSDNQPSFDQLEAKADDLAEYLLHGPCSKTEYDTFYNYVQTLKNITYQDLELHGSFLSPSEYSEEFIEAEAAIFANAFHGKEFFAYTFIRLGGQTMNDSSGATAVNPVFRNAMWTLGYGGDGSSAQEYGDLLKRTVLTKGQYYNQCEDDLPPEEWQMQFWGNDTYSKLLMIKMKYDPHNHFTCKQCVGSNANHLATNIAAIVLILCSHLYRITA